MQLRSLILSLCVLALPALASAQSVNPLFDNYYPKIEREFDKQEAFNTVAFVEKYWRVVGNEGFDQSIYHVAQKLEKAGFVEEGKSNEYSRLVYRIEKRPLKTPAWEPVSACLKLANGEEIMNFATNRNMITMRSFSTPGEQEYEIVYVGQGSKSEMDQDLEGKVVFVDNAPGLVFRTAVKKKGAVGIIGYRMPGYLQPEKNVNSIQFGGIPYDETEQSFGILLSYEARQKLKAALDAGDKTVKVQIETKSYPSEELTLVAELKGSKMPEERFVFSAHVQEPGANDNASGVGALAEMAAVSAKLLKARKIEPERTITFLFGDEIVSTRRFIQEDKARAKNIKWGMSLDMVGENTAVTGGTFLIEKMPDPGAIWVRGVEKHTEWGGRALKKEQLKPHYFNDLAIGVFEEIGRRKNWVVKFNPFEGGSDHVPFLRANIPGLLLWHFTDQFYHTDQDRIDKVSPETLKNVGTGALTIALMLTENKAELAESLLAMVSEAALKRLEAELVVSKAALKEGSTIEQERDILNTWYTYYEEVIDSLLDVDVSSDGPYAEKRLEVRWALLEKKSDVFIRLAE